MGGAPPALVEHIADDEPGIDDRTDVDIDRPRADAVALREELPLAPHIGDDEEPEDRLQPEDEDDKDEEDEDELEDKE